jgi:hypothetical protein
LPPIIVYGLLGRTAAPPGAIAGEIHTSEVRAQLARAAAIRDIKDVKARAKAIGTIMG